MKIGKKLQEKTPKLISIGWFLAVWFIMYQWVIAQPTPGIRIPELREEIVAVFTLLATVLLSVFYDMFKCWWEKE